MIAIKKTWNKAERKAWKLQKPMLPSKWAEKYRTLYRSNIPGPYRNENAPYLRGMMDIASRPGVEQLNIKKGAQLGVSEAVRNLIGYWATREPDPIGLTLPDRIKGRKIVRLDVIPMFMQTPVLNDMLKSSSRNALVEIIMLSNGFQLELMWSGSATSTASNPYRRVINDEVDKFEAWAGSEPDPVGRTWKRMRTYGERRCQINVSTPTVTTGSIHTLVMSSSVILYYYVPCPYCGHFQFLTFTQLHWETLKVKSKEKLADLIAQGGEVWYECINCEEKIKEEQKAIMVNKGKWTTEEGFVRDFWGKKHEHAETVERWPRGTRVGMQISALYGLWEKWSDVVVEFLRAKGHLDRSFNFRTETLGEPFEFQVARVRSGLFNQKVKRARLDAGVVPKWAWCLILTIDTQRDYFYAVVRAWGSGMKSQRVWHGRILNFEDLDKLIYHTQWKVEKEACPPMRIALALIDSGGTEDLVMGASRTMQVYKWAVPRQAIVRAIKGASRPGDNLYWPMRNPTPSKSSKQRKAPKELRAYMVDPHKAKDLLADLVVRGVPEKAGQKTIEQEEELWLLNNVPDDNYNKQMSSMHKTVEKKGQQLIEKWKLIHAGSRRDYHDCESYQIIGAYMYHIPFLPPEKEILEKKEQERIDTIRAENRKEETVRDVVGRTHHNPYEVTPFEPLSF
tara:strand:+ start:961 stop:2994 length:2034 start_codon:yes stop_codon:yes gene_type:complete